MPYFQDDWRVSQRLTLNLGARYDYYQSPYDKNGHSNVFDVPTNTNHPGTFHQNYNNFAPRFGFAYALRSSTILRGGYGIDYAIPLYNNFQFLMANAPNYIQQNYTYTAKQPVPLLAALVTNPDSSSQAPFTMIMPTEYVQQRNLSIQQGLGRHITAQLDYLGANSLHLQMRRNGNQGYVPEDPNNPGTLQGRRLPNLSSISLGPNLEMTLLHRGLHPPTHPHSSHSPLWSRARSPLEWMPLDS